MAKSARGFRKIEELTLSNGETVKLRKPDLQAIVLSAKNGEIPSFLRQKVVDGFNGNKSSEPTPDVIINIDNAHEFVPFFDLITKAALMWPVIKDNPVNEDDVDNGFISIDDLQLMDKFQITMWAMPEEAKAAESFREKQSANVGSSPDVQDLRTETINGDGL